MGSTVRWTADAQQDGSCRDHRRNLLSFEEPAPGGGERARKSRPQPGGGFRYRLDLSRALAGEPPSGGGPPPTTRATAARVISRTRKTSQETAGLCQWLGMAWIARVGSQPRGRRSSPPQSGTPRGHHGTSVDSLAGSWAVTWPKNLLSLDIHGCPQPEPGAGEEMVGQGPRRPRARRTVAASPNRAHHDCRTLRTWRWGRRKKDA